MKILGISGSNASGKDTVGAMLVERYGFVFCSVTDVLRDEARRRSWEVTRENLAEISAEWRRERGMGVLVEIAISQIDTSKTPGIAIASLRHPGEVLAVHKHGGKVVWVDADPEVRYLRIIGSRRKGRESEDNKTFEEFTREEQREMSQQGDSATLNMAAVKDAADFVIINNGNDIKRFKDTAEQRLAEFLSD